VIHIWLAFELSATVFVQGNAWVPLQFQAGRNEPSVFVIIGSHMKPLLVCTSGDTSAWISPEVKLAAILDITRGSFELTGAWVAMPVAEANCPSIAS